MTWKCSECKSNHVQFRSRTHDYRCKACGSVMAVPVITKTIVTGRPPKHLRVKA